MDLSAPATTPATTPARTRTSTRVALVLLLLVWIALVAWAVLFKLHEPFIGRDDMRALKLIPFVPGNGYDGSAPIEVVQNVLLFVPLGLLLHTLVRWPEGGTVALLAGFSVALEASQFALATGSSDVTDVLTNTAGAAIGVAVAAWLRRRHPDRAAGIVLRLVVVATVLALVVVAVLIARFPQFAGPGPGDFLVE